MRIVLSLWDSNNNNKQFTWAVCILNKDMSWLGFIRPNALNSNNKIPGSTFSYMQYTNVN